MIQMVWVLPEARKSNKADIFLEPPGTYTKTHRKLVYTKDKENIMKEAGVKLYITYRKKTIQMTVYFSEKNLRGQKEGI